MSLALLSACSRDAAAPPGVIVVGVRQPPNNLDPRFATDETSQRINHLVFSSLMDIGEDLRIVPTLAERLDNPDPLTYIASLRRGVTFHDGRELTAADVVWNYEYYLHPASTSPFRGAFRVLESVRALDIYTVEFKLKEPFTSFPIQLVSPPIVPAGSGPDFNQSLIGTGPYRFVRYDVDDRVVLEPFPDYFEGAPKNNGIIVRVIPDDTMLGLEVKKGAVHVVVNLIPPDIVHQLQEDGTIDLAQSPGLDFMYLNLNTQDSILRDRRVRQALAYAVDREAIVRYLRRGLARVATGLIPPQSWAYEPGIPQFPHDPARARALLDEAGYPDPDGDGPLPRFRLTMKLGVNEEFRSQAAVIQEDLRGIGVDLEIQSMEFATLFADVVSGQFQIAQMQWAGGAVVDPDMLRRVFHTDQAPPNGFNRGRYSNPEVDRLLDLAGARADENARRAYYSEAQKIIAEDSPYVPL
ncbi:MAG: ABC transporter substrate-binding protein, partial [Vicinamibacterales bacterium]